MPTVSSSHPPLDDCESAFSEDLFQSLLENINLSARRIEALTRLALRHLSAAPETWSALRRALVDTPAAAHREPRYKALWALWDSLLKHCTPVFAPLMVPRLEEYVSQLMPWDRLDWQAAEDLWWEEMVLSWAPVLPAPVFGAVKRVVVDHRSQAKLHGVLEAQSLGYSASVEEGKAPASAEDMNRLREDWKELQVMCAARTQAARQQAQQSSYEALLAQVTSVRDGSGYPVAVPAAESGTHSTGSASDEDYSPEFVAGAKPRVLPDLGLPTRRRRGARRPRDDDDF